MKVKYYPYQPHCFAFGGFDLQMLNALDAVKRHEVDASKLDIWSRDIDFDVIHLWGVGPHNYHIIDWARKSKKKIVATVLVSYFDTLRLKLSYIRNFNSTWQRELIQYYRLLDKIVVVNELQSVVLSKYYKVDASRIEVIPNIIEDNFFERPNFDFSRKYNINDYILCTGNICQRKNQLNLAKACMKLNKKLVLIGDVLDGEEFYAKELEVLVLNNPKMRWIKELPNGSKELAAAYYNCSVFALPSKNETQPISALEAAVLGKPLLLANKTYARQKYFKNACLTDPESVESIMASIKKILAKPEIFSTPKSYFSDLKSVCVGEKYLDLYNSLK